MSLVLLGAPPAGVSTAGVAAAGAAPPAVWARAAARMSLVDFGTPAGLGVAAAPRSVRRVRQACSAAGVSAAGAGEASAGGLRRAAAPVWARAAFRISSVESFFAICSSTRNFSGDASAGPPAIRSARRRPAGSACRFGRILSACRQPVHTEGQCVKRFPRSRNARPTSFPSTRNSEPPVAAFTQSASPVGTARKSALESFREPETRKIEQEITEATERGTGAERSTGEVGFNFLIFAPLTPLPPVQIPRFVPPRTGSRASLLD